MAYATIDGFYNNDTLNGHINQYKTTNGGASAVQHEQTRGIQLYIKIPEKQVECEITVDLNAKVWEVKRQIIYLLGTDLDESYNFGLFLPPEEKRLGKYLSEDRCIREYRLRGLPPTVLFKYYAKTEQQTNATIKANKIKDSQTRFFEHVLEANADKCLKFLERGLDPNFIHRGSGHTPLTKAAVGKDARDMIMLLCRYGAFLEFRDRSGFTALHHAAVAGAHEAMQVLLDAGASVNARDLKGLSPLYNAICDGNSTYSCEILLKERCDVNLTDNTGQWNEVHQACKRGKTDVAELLLLYGTEINAKTSAGNSALHISASFNKVHCARQLLVRGIEKDMRNKAGQTAYDVAALTSNFVIMDDISNFKSSQTEPFSTTPTYTNRKKDPVLPRDRQDSCSSNRSTHSADNNDAAQTPSRGGTSRTHHRSSSSSSASQRGVHRSQTISEERVPLLEVEARRPVSGIERTESIGASSSSICSTASTHRALPPEFPAPSNSTLQMTLEELIKTARICKVPRTKRGYGFHMKGLAEKKKAFSPSVEAPCAQFMFAVDDGSESHKAGVLANDFIYQVNGKDVSVASHKEVVEMIKKSGDPLVIAVIQVSNNVPTATPATAQPPQAAKAPPPVVPRRDPNTRLQGPRQTMSRSATLAADSSYSSAMSNGDEQIYANLEHQKTPTPERTPQLNKTRPLERMNSAPGGVTRGDGYVRCNTLPARHQAALEAHAEEEKKEEVMVAVLPQASKSEIREQRRRLTSINTENHSLISTQSEPAKPVSQSPDNRPVLDDAVPPRSKSHEDIARKAAEIRKKRSSAEPGEKVYNYDLPPPPAVIPPPPPPDDLPPPPPDIDSKPAPSVESSVEEPTTVPPPPPEEEVTPVKEAPPVEKALPVAASTPVEKASLASTSPPLPCEGDREDNESYDSGFIQNGKQVEDWEATDVADWLSGLGLGEYKEIFKENDIRGANLMDLTKNDLKELGVTKLGHRITMMKEITSRLSDSR